MMVVFPEFQLILLLRLKNLMVERVTSIQQESGQLLWYISKIDFNLDYLLDIIPNVKKKERRY